MGITIWWKTKSDEEKSRLVDALGRRYRLFARAISIQLNYATFGSQHSFVLSNFVNMNKRELPNNEHLYNPKCKSLKNLVK
jgi:hypothetical protein